MSEKAVITQRQADAIEELSLNHSKEDLVSGYSDYLFSLRAGEKSVAFPKANEDIKGLTIGTLAQALYAGYDIVEELQTFVVPVLWTMEGTLDVKARTIDEAIDIVMDDQDFPVNGQYADGSFEVDKYYINYINDQSEETL